VTPVGRATTRGCMAMATQWLLVVASSSGLTATSAMASVVDLAATSATASVVVTIVGSAATSRTAAALVGGRAAVALNVDRRLALVPSVYGLPAAASDAAARSLADSGG